MWGLLKGKVYANKPHAIDNLKEKIAVIPVDMLRSLEHRIQLCMKAGATTISTSCDGLQFHKDGGMHLQHSVTIHA
jgi:hypothetical protein